MPNRPDSKQNVLFLNEIGEQDVDIAGGKGANLGELLQQGFPVPPGFVITARVYEDLVGSLGGSTPGLSPEEISAAILEITLPQELLTSIEIHDQQLRAEQSDGLVYAVRSSATAEDMGDASFAGQHDTYYYVSSEQLPMMIKKCWASLWAEGAYSYRESQGIDHHQVYMAVIVQEMIRSEISGITFTSDPLSGNQNLIVTDCSWGMGAAIVDGRVSPDHYSVEKSSGKLVSKRIADKKFMVPASITDGESRLLPVPFSLRNKECLSEKQIDLISHWAMKSEEYFGCPQDLEWAFFQDEYYLLQSRPITALGEKKDDIPKGTFVLFKPLFENFTDPLLPLTQDLLIKLFPMMNIIQGRVYLNLKHIRLLLPFKMTEAETAEIAYLSNKNDFKPRLSWTRTLILITILYINNLNVGVLYQRTNHMPIDFMSSFRKKFRQVVNDDSIDAPGALEHLFFKAGFFDSVGNMPFMVNLAAPRYMFYIPILSRLLKWWIPDIREDAAAYLTAGSEGVFSTDMGREIWHLSVIAKNETIVKEIIHTNESSQALVLLKDEPNARVFLSALEVFLDTHGHRTLKEFELSSFRWAEDPAPIISMIRNYLQSDVNPLKSEQSIKEKRLTFAEEIKDKLKIHPLENMLNIRWKIITTLVDQAKYFIRLRENSRFFHIMAFYAIRLKVLKLENLLLSTGKLKCKDDIFYLNWEELSMLKEGKLEWDDLEDTMRARRMDYIRLSKIKPSKTFGIDVPKQSTFTENQILGQGASPGQYEGIARVITDPTTDAELHSGEILIAPYTDPAWTPLFLTASAAVVEVGSFLSHAGTIAREYGMPCVVDAADCMTRIKTGDRILVDGSSGQISFIVEPEIEESVDA